MCTTFFLHRYINSHRKVAVFENLKVVSLQSAADTRVWRYRKHTCTSHLERRSKTGATRSKSSIGRERGRWRTARVLIAIRENLSVIQRSGGTGCKHGQPSGEKRSAFRKRSRGARGTRKRASRGQDARRAPRRAVQNESLVSGRTDACIPSWNGITYASHYSAMREFEHDIC